MLPLIIASISFSALIGVCGSVSAAAAAQVLSSQTQIDTLLDCLHENIPTSSIITPGDANFLNDSIRWTTLGAPSYSVLVNAGSEEDIATSIRCATQSGVKFLATGPRHGYSITLGSVQNGLQINTAFLDRLRVDPDTNTLTAGGSVTFGQPPGN